MSKHLGQHFLKNEAVIKEIIEAIAPQKGDRIIEIGPGRGALTIPLAKMAQNVGVNLSAIEKDAKLAGELTSELKESGVEIEVADALIVLKSSNFSSKTKLVGNIPYYITGHLLRTIGELENKPELCIFMVQEEVAERIAERPPRMNRLAASVQFWAKPKIILRVGRRDFSPPPEVDSAVISLEIKKYDADMVASYDKAVQAIFAQPRKTIANNVFDAQKYSSEPIPKEKVAEILKKIGIEPSNRPQNLGIEDIEAIAKAFSKNFQGL